MENDDFNEFQIISSFLWNLNIADFILLRSSENDTVEVYTIQPFSETSCRSPALIPICKGFPPTKCNFFRNKLTNFFKCPIRVASYNWPLTFEIVEDPVRKEVRISGFEYTILKQLSTTLNSTLITYTPPLSKEFATLSSGTVELIFNATREKKVDLCVGSLNFRKDRVEQFSAPDTYYMIYYIVYIKNNKLPLSFLKVILSPLQLWIWISTLVLLVLAFLLLGFIRKKYSLMEITSITFSVPVRNSSTKISERLILGSWMFFSIIFSTLYHGMFYGQLLNLWEPLPRNFEDLLAQNYTLIAHPVSYINIKNIPEIKGINKILTAEDHALYLNKIVTRSKEKLVSVISSPYLYYNLTKYYKDRIHVISKDWLPIQYAFYLQKDSFLLKPMNRLILKLKSFGIIQKMADKHFGTYSKKPEVLRNHVAVLTLETLGGFFQMFFVIQGIEVLIFFIEFFSNYYVKKRARFEFLV